MMFRLKNSQLFFALFFALFFLAPAMVFGRIGVGVGTGKIVVDQPLKPGLIYTLPSLSILNTGDEPGEYEASIQYHEGQETKQGMGLKPAQEWFEFEPSKFHLEPGQVQQVQIKLSLPVKEVKPGTYFAYLEGHPIKKSVAGQTSVGVAAAAKLYFTVAPANIFQGIYYRFISLYTRYHPLDTIAFAIFFIILAGMFLRKRFNIQIVAKK